MIIKQPYTKEGHTGDGILYGSGDAKHRNKHTDKTVYLCVPLANIFLEPGAYRFYRIVDNKPVEVDQTRNFYTGSRYIDRQFYVAREVK